MADLPTITLILGTGRIMPEFLSWCNCGKEILNTEAGNESGGSSYKSEVSPHKPYLMD